MKTSNLFPETITCGHSTSLFGGSNALTVEKVQSIADVGVKWIEIGALQPQHMNIWDDEMIDVLQKGIPTTGVKVWSLHAPFCGLGMDDKDTRAYAVRRLVRSAKVAKYFGASRVVVHPGRFVPSTHRKQELEWIVETVTQALESIPTDVMVAIETLMLPRLGAPLEDMLWLMEQLPADRVGVCVDVGHLNIWTNPVSFIQKLTNRISTVHLQDNMGEKDSHFLAGSGTIVWPEVLQALKNAGYKGVLISEGEDDDKTPQQNSIEFCTRMKQFLA